MSVTSLDNLLSFLEKQNPLLFKEGPPRPGLLPQSGDWQHPDRWVRPEKEGEHIPKSSIPREEIGKIKGWKRFAGEWPSIDEPGYSYHTTFSDKLSQIIDEGLRPQEQHTFPGYSREGKVSLTPTLKGAADWSSLAFWRRYDENKVFHPLLLCTSVTVTPTERSDEVVTDSIPPQKLELWREGRWVPIQEQKERLKKQEGGLPGGGTVAISTNPGIFTPTYGGDTKNKKPHFSALSKLVEYVELEKHQTEETHLHPPDFESKHVGKAQTGTELSIPTDEDSPEVQREQYVLDKARPGLIPKKVRVEREGKTFQSTRWVRPEEATTKTPQAPSTIAQKYNLKVEGVDSSLIKRLLDEFPPQFSEIIGNKAYPLEIVATNKHFKGGDYSWREHKIRVNPILFKKLTLASMSSPNYPYPGISADSFGDLVLLHEMSHAVFYGFQNDRFLTMRAEWTNVSREFPKWRDAKKLITEYSAVNASEFFAECFVYYLRAPEVLQQVHPAVFAFFDKYFKSQKLEKQDENADDFEPGLGAWWFETEEGWEKLTQGMEDNNESLQKHLSGEHDQKEHGKEHEIDWAELASRNYYKTVSGHNIESPADINTWKGLSLEDLQRLQQEEPEKIIGVKFGDTRGGGVNRREVRVKNLILPITEISKNGEAKLEKQDVPLSVKAIITDKAGRVLIMRDSTPGSSWWDLPGGHVDSQEPSLEEALRREVLEETGLKVEDIKELDMSGDVKIGKDNHPVLFYRASAKGELELSPEHEKLAWVTTDNIDKYNLGAFKDVVESALEQPLAKLQPPRPGLVPKTGSYEHPERWIKEEGVATKDAQQVISGSNKANPNFDKEAYDYQLGVLERLVKSQKWGTSEGGSNVRFRLENLGDALREIVGNGAEDYVEEKLSRVEHSLKDSEWRAPLDEQSKGMLILMQLKLESFPAKSERAKLAQQLMMAGVRRDTDKMKQLIDKVRALHTLKRIEKQEDGSLEKAADNQPDAYSEDFYSWIDSELEPLEKEGVVIGGNPPKGAKGVGKNVELRLYSSLREAVEDFLKELTGTETQEEVLQGMKEVIEKWSKENLVTTENAFESLFKRGFMAGVVSAGLSGKMGTNDENAMNVLKQGKYRIGERIQLFGDEAIKDFASIIREAYTPEGTFDLDNLVKRMREAVPDKRWRLERVARTETSNISGAGKIWAWSKDKDKNRWNYFWSHSNDNRVRKMKRIRATWSPLTFSEAAYLWTHNEQLVDGKWENGNIQCRCQIIRYPRDDEYTGNRFEGLENQFRRTMDVDFS